MGDAETFINLLKGGGVLGILGLVVYLIMRGVLRLGREDQAAKEFHAQRIADAAQRVADRDRELARLEKDLQERTADRDKWISVVLAHAPIIEKQSAAMIAQAAAIADLKEVVEDLTQALKAKPG